MSRPAGTSHTSPPSLSTPLRTQANEDWSLGEESELVGHEVECCLHQARFDVRTGAATGNPATAALKTFAVRVVDDEVWVDV
jgi:nitrite reductase/ring-hydroxylating ferredoxin subunit